MMETTFAVALFLSYYSCICILGELMQWTKYGSITYKEMPGGPAISPMFIETHIFIH